MLSDDEIRILGLAAPQLLHLLGLREERILKRIYGEWKAGKHDQMLALAEWVCVRDQVQEIKAVLGRHHNEEVRKHATEE